MDTKIYKVWTEEFKGYYWENEENGIYEYTWDDDHDDVEDILDASILRELEQDNKKAREFGGYPKRVVAECFTPVELSEEDLTALKQDVLNDENDNLFKELDESYRIENYDNLYYINGELYYYDENTSKLCYCESEGMLNPVGYDPNDDGLFHVDGELYYFDNNTSKLFQCESEGMLNPVVYDTNDDDLFYVNGELYYFDDNTKKLFHCESGERLNPVGYDPNDDSDDNE